MTKTVVILGGAYAGVHIAHYLLKKKDLDIKVILVSKNSHFYWNIASVRHVVPGIYKDDQLLQPLETALKRYPAQKWEVVVGTAEKADFAAKTVAVSTGSETRTLAYDQLVLATGSRCATPDVPWKSLDTYEATVAKLHDLQARAKAARHIVVAGGGSTGIELAGELAYEWGKEKEVVLLSSGDKLLGGDSIADSAAAELKKLGVTIRTNVTVESHAPIQDGEGKSRTEVLLKGNGRLVTDLYLPTTGLVPNSEYVDAAYLTPRKTVKVDAFLRVDGLTDVWAAGDIVSEPRAGFMITQKQAAGVGKNVELVLRGKEPLVIKPMPVDILACAVGRNRGVGRMGSIKLFSVLVWLSKGRTLAVERLPTYIDGSIA